MSHRKDKNARVLVLKDERDRDAFVRAMLRPPSPSERLRAAAVRYRAKTLLGHQPNVLRR
jgi:uncharacterized protein (DUF1778 family)